MRKVELATILGTIQSTLTNYRYLRSVWKRNQEEERLLGVSLTGIMDCPVAYYNDEHVLKDLKEHAISVNKTFADYLGINVSASITCVKPSGTVSQLAGCSSGIHPAYSDYYVRTIRGDNRDPLTKALKEAGIPSEPCVMKPDSTTIFSFPVASPATSITRNEMGAIQQLELYKEFVEDWCEHNVSITVYVKEEEWLKVAAWVYENWDSCVGAAFLPHSDHVYKQAPYQEITREEYDILYSKMPTSIDWSLMVEETDNTTGSQELACVGTSCELT